ncbi:MAG: alpha-amylase, partial [Firmicutes bacterium]|nr:alpha-amylase [Bacillota bacterium]
SLVMWAQIVDGFRCDVASCVPVEFWRQAREACEKVRPGCIWLAESVHGSFANLHRQLGMYCATDYDMFSVFDMEYDYDIREVFDRYLKGECALSNYMDVLNFQECQYPADYNKMRCLENHDQPRICSFVKDSKVLENYTAFLYFLKGTTLIYAGQEFCNDHLPSLFEQEVFDRKPEQDISPLLKKLYNIKKCLLSEADYIRYSCDDENHIAILERDDSLTKKLGVFSLKGLSGKVKVPFADGNYINRLSGKTVSVVEGAVFCDGDPIILVDDGI